jgi:hypothetical protein
MVDVTTLENWAALAQAAQPLIAAGEVLVTDIVGLFKSKNPDATNDELNAALGAIMTEGAAEIGAIDQEIKDAEQAPATPAPPVPEPDPAAAGPSAPAETPAHAPAADATGEPANG